MTYNNEILNNELNDTLENFDFTSEHPDYTSEIYHPQPFDSLEKPTYVHLVYKTTNKITGQYYIGQHSELLQKPDNYLGSGVLLKQDISLWGRENFSKEVIAVFYNREDALDIESMLVSEEVINDPDSYNLLLSGKMIKGIKLSEEWIENMRKPKSTTENMKKPKSEKHRLSMRKPKTQEHKENIRKARTGKVFMNDGQKNYLVAKENIESYKKQRGYVEGKLKEIA